MSDSSMPPLNVDRTPDYPAGDLAECPVCGQECYHPVRLNRSDELVVLTNWWECIECDYEYCENY